MIADYWRTLATINGKAAALGDAEVFLGDYELAFALPDNLGTITVADVQRVAAKVLRLNNMTVGVLRSAIDEGAN